MEVNSSSVVAYETEESSDENQPPPENIHDLVLYDNNNPTLVPPLKITFPENKALVVSTLDMNSRAEGTSLICRKFEQKGQLVVRKNENKIISKEGNSMELAAYSKERNIVNPNISKDIIVIRNNENKIISKEENSKEVIVYNSERNIVNPNVSKEIVSYDSNFQSIWIPLRKDIITFKVRNIIKTYSWIMTNTLMSIMITRIFFNGTTSTAGIGFNVEFP